MTPFPSKSFKDKNLAKAMGKKGGLANTTIKTKYAAQLREMRKRGNTNEQIAFFVKRLEDPTANIIHIQQALDRIVKDNPEHIQAINSLIQLHRAHFGDKHISLNLNVNVDVEAELVDIRDHIAKVIK